MKKLLYLAILSIGLMSCSDMITVEDTNTGKIMRVREAHGVIKVNDTLIVAVTQSGGYGFYGTYKGKLPQAYGTKIHYLICKRIK